jgi:RHS repeat-associated protein
VYGSYVDEPLLLRANGNRYYYATNRLYSVAAITSQAGQVVERYKYDAYGKQAILADNGVVAYKPSDYGQFRGYTGYHHDHESGLAYARSRMYDAQTGVFLSRNAWSPVLRGILPDPYYPNEVAAGGVGSYIQGRMNLYQLALGSPANFTEPFSQANANEHFPPFSPPPSRPHVVSPSGQYSRPGSGPISYRPRPTYIGGFPIQAGHVYDQYAGDYRTGLTYAPSTPTMTGEEALVNLISLALMFTPAGEAVIVGRNGARLATGCCPKPGPLLNKGQRLDLVYGFVREIPPATSAEQAMQQFHRTLDAVEDAFSGVCKSSNPGLKPDGRMYPALPDRMSFEPDGSIVATSRGHITTYGPDGSITVIDRLSGATVFSKPGGGVGP